MILTQIFWNNNIKILMCWENIAQSLSILKNFGTLYHIRLTNFVVTWKSYEITSYLIPLVPQILSSMTMLEIFFWKYMKNPSWSTDLYGTRYHYFFVNFLYLFYYYYFFHMKTTIYFFWAREMFCPWMCWWIFQ